MNSVQRSDYAAIYNLLAHGDDLAIITIITRKGSTPRFSGTRMVITVDERSFGTIGGGFCEADAVRIAKDVLTQKKSKILRYTSAHGSPLQDDIICGGSLDILVEFLPSDRYHTELIGEFVTHQNNRETPVMIIPLPGDDSARFRFFVRPDGSVSGNSSDIQVSRIMEGMKGAPLPGVCTPGSAQVFVEPCLPPCRLIICGAGHIASEVAPLASHLGFIVHVLDDRQNLLDGFKSTGVKTTFISSFETCLESIPPDYSTGILIASRSHLFDLQILRQAVSRPAFFIGMVGSRHKRRALDEILMAEGVSGDALCKVSCPVGVTIGADSPEEIAVSIASELIQKRSERIYSLPAPSPGMKGH